VITAQEEERRRVALELHDDTGQSLTAVIMGLGAARSVLARDPARASGMLEETRELAVHALRGVRELILGLRPASLDDLGLVPALHRLGEDIGRRGGFQVEIDGSGLHRRLPPEVETVLFRIVQEGFNNVAQHSRAKRVRLSFRILGRDVEATLEDDGIGFDLPKVRGTRGGLNGLGLVGMQERASLLNGRVEIQSRPGKGTQLTLRLPCSASPANSAADDGAEQQLDPVEITSGSD
jgi:signal transduction histidine kinase